ncbi:rhodanese-like domain-containing protein [Patescibacteria group bacterium]
MIKSIGVREFNQEIEKSSDDVEIIDVREPEEYAQIRIKGSKLIPMGEIIKKIKNIDWTKKIILVCRSGARSMYAADLISSNGHTDKDIYNLDGGINALEMAECKCLEK